MKTIEPAAVIAANLCWLARQPGLPQIPALRQSIAERHPTTCAWCDFPLIELMALGMDDLERRRFERVPAAYRAGYQDGTDAAVGSRVTGVLIGAVSGFVVGVLVALLVLGGVAVSKPFPVLLMEGGTPLDRCAVCEAVAHAVVTADIEIMPVWSLDPADLCHQHVRIGLCVDCIRSLSDGTDLRARTLYVPFSPGRDVRTGVHEQARMNRHLTYLRGRPVQ